MFMYEAKQFCMSTALHGYRFIILPKRLLLERVIWTVVTLVSLIAALCLLCIAWFRFQANPTILVTDSTHHPIWNYPFPAVTVCDYNKISSLKTREQAQILVGYTNQSLEWMIDRLRLLSKLIHNNNDNLPLLNYLQIQGILDVNNIKLDRFLQIIAPSCSKLLVGCKWKGEEKRCETLFQQILTTEGYCCSFNYFAAKNHSFSQVIARKSPKNPRRVSACGYQTGLEVLVHTDVMDYLASEVHSYGYKILVHNSYHYPDWSVNSVLSEVRRMTLIGVNPVLTYATESVRTLDVEKRHCYFPDEMKLRYFNIYTFHNCMVECRMNLSIALCGCLQITFLNPNDGSNGDKMHRTCKLDDLNCLTRNKHLIRSSAPGFDVKNINISSHEWSSADNECNCLPDCEHVDYLIEGSFGLLTREFSNNQQNLYGRGPLGNHSVFRVFFNDLVAVKNRRDVTFNWYTLLAYYGGLLGLFIGFSFVSAIELVYFFTIRLMFDTSRKSPKIRTNAMSIPTIEIATVDEPAPVHLQLPMNGGIRKRSNPKNQMIKPSYY